MKPYRRNVVLLPIIGLSFAMFRTCRTARTFGFPGWQPKLTGDFFRPDLHTDGAKFG